MFKSFGKLLCVAALASAALAQSTITIVSPTAGTSLKAGSSVNIELERTPSSDGTEVGFAITASACPGGVCTAPALHGNIGSLLHAGAFNAQSTNGSGYAFDTISVTVPLPWNGPVEFSLGHFYLTGPYSTAELDFTSVTVEVYGAQG